MDRRTDADLLRDAIIEPTEETVAALLSSGPGSVSSFRDWLDGGLKLEFPEGRDREFIDNTSAVSCRLASHYPRDYVRAFGDPRWINNGFVLAGLGYTKQPEAEPLLVQALFSDAPGVTRLTAARSLRFFATERSVQALLGALEDPEYLVQYHAIESLGAVGGQSALDRLRGIAANPSSRGVEYAARGAVRAIAARLGVDADVPDSRRFPRLRFRVIRQGKAGR